MMIARHFKDYHFFLLENDSEDATAHWLRVVSKKDPKFEHKSERLMLGNERSTERARFKRMADLRNRLRDWIESFVRQNAGWDLIVMLDIDIFKAGPFAVSTHSFFSALGRPETYANQWDMLCSNGIHSLKTGHDHFSMHDCFAFRTEGSDWWNAENCSSDKEVGLKLWLGYDLVPVHSCFGGMAFYKPDALFRCRYDPAVFDCEHVTLHQCMREHGSENRMFMDQLLTVNYDAFVHQSCLPSRGDL
ncbi:unnamed protein product [Prorocentrum cordatum]|uniref:Hexosyltransferase n=1 Tax=Prorocentrum cordatum TaxID=2364126 RepID=A0ABN9SUQ6_9DINO|nr:unnamed protein product [Polarella glacialis]